VREPGGLIGTADRRFTVRALDGPSIQSGDLLVSAPRGELPVRASAYTGDGFSGVIEIYARTTQQLEGARVVVDLVPAGEQSAVVSGEAEWMETRTTARGVAREARFALLLPSVVPGAYVSRARVLVSGETVSESAREVDVRAGRRPDGPRPVNAAGMTDVFDPREIVGSALVRGFTARFGDAAWSADARRGLDRLGAADYPAAIDAFDAVLRFDARNGVAAFLQGWAYHGAGQDRQAISAWRRAVFVDPTCVPAHLA